LWFGDKDDYNQMGASRRNLAKGMLTDDDTTFWTDDDSRDKTFIWEKEPQDHQRTKKDSGCVIEDEHEYKVVIDGLGQLDSSLDTEGVVESEAFEWLVRGLLRQSCYRLDEKQLRPVVSQRIVDEIPTSTMISSQDAPKSYKVIFQLPWDTLRTDLQLESVIFTSSSDFEIQATTVEDYLDQTWGHRGRDILSVVESVLKHRTGKDASPGM
jgi:hypothetical protein